MARFTQTFHISREAEIKTVRLSIATSEGRVDEITLPDRDFRLVAHALWEKVTIYEGCMVMQAKYKPETGYLSLSIQTGAYTRSVYRVHENEVMAAVGRYMAETGGE